MGALLYVFFGLIAVIGRMVGQLLAVRWTLPEIAGGQLRTSTLLDAWRRLARVTEPSERRLSAGARRHSTGRHHATD